MKMYDRFEVRVDKENNNYIVDSHTGFKVTSLEQACACLNGLVGYYEGYYDNLVKAKK